MKRPIEFTIPVDDFDTARLPEGSREPGSAAFKAAVARFYENEFAQAEGSVAVRFAEAEIRVKWIPKEGPADPDNEVVLFNLGMAESDMGKLDEARAHLESAVAIEPQYAAAWVALGVAQQRSRMPDEAIASFVAALLVDPENAYAERSLGAVLGNAGNHEEAEKHFRRATILAPNDQVAYVGLAQAVESLGRFDEADELYARLIRMDPDSRAAEKAKEARGAIASRGFRIQSIGRDRPDAVMFCLAALEEFEQLPSEEILAVVSEIAALGQTGLAVNDPARKYELKSLPGRQFGGLQLVAMMYVGFKGIKPSADVGFDLSKEYEQAGALYQAKRG